MRIKFTLITLTFLLIFNSLTSAQIEVKYFRCDNSENVPANKPVTIVYPFAIQDTNGMELSVVSLAKYIVFESSGGIVPFSAFNDKPNQITIVPHDDMVGGQTYNITISPVRYAETGDLSESFQCQFSVSNYTNQQTVETAYLTSFGNLIQLLNYTSLPVDTIVSYLIPENHSYLNFADNQALRMKAVAPIFDVLSRKPELQEDIFIQSINALGSIDEVGVLSPEAESERMLSLANLFIATSRQPEVSDTLNLLTDTLLGVPEDFSLISDKAKLARMKSLGMIFEAIARQPEFFRIILDQGLKYCGSIGMLGEINSETEGARMLSLGNMFYAIARQPIVLDSLIITADTLFGVPSDFSVFDDTVLAMRMRALSLIFDASARQPEMADSIFQQAVRYMGRFSELNPLDSVSGAFRMSSLGHLWDAMSRNPGVSEKMCFMADTLMGIPEDFSALSNFEIEERIKGLTPLFLDMARQPEISDSLISKAIKYCGSALQVGELPERALFYTMYLYGFAFEAIARNPEVWHKEELALDTLVGVYNNDSSFSSVVHKGRAEAIKMLFNAIVRQPGYCDTLTLLAEKYLGTSNQFSSIPDESRFYAVGALIQSVMQQFEYFDTLDLVAEKLIGVPDDFSTISDEAVYMRSSAFYGLDQGYNFDSVAFDSAVSLLYKYLGTWQDINKESEFSEMARIDALPTLLKMISSDSSKTTPYLDLFEKFFGSRNYSEFTRSVSVRRQQVLPKFYSRYLQSVNKSVSDSLCKASSKIIGTIADCPIQTWSEAEARMAALSDFFEYMCNSYYSKSGSKASMLENNNLKFDEFFKGVNNGIVEPNSFDKVEQTKGLSTITLKTIDVESLEKLVSVMEEFSGSADSSLGSNSRVDYYRQLADGYLTSWLSVNSIPDSIIKDVRKRLLGTYASDKPILYGDPSHNSINVPIGYKPHLLFTDVMYASDSTLLSAANVHDSIKLLTINNEPVEFTMESNSNNRTISIVPNEVLTHGMQYKLMVPECFYNFDDSVANSISNTFKVEKANLKITAEDKEMDEGNQVPELTMIFEGFVDGDTQDSIVKPEIYTEADSSSEPGTYPIILSGGSSEKYNFELINGTLTINKVIGINSEPVNSGVRMFPNPVTNILNFESMRSDSQISDVKIINQLGQLVFEQHIGVNKSSINISKLKSGLYIVVFKIKNQPSILCNIMKQ